MSPLALLFPLCPIPPYPTPPSRPSSLSAFLSLSYISHLLALPNYLHQPDLIRQTTPRYALPHGHQHQRPVRESKWRAPTSLRSILCLKRPKSDSTLTPWPRPRRNDTGTRTVNQYVPPLHFSLVLTPVSHRARTALSRSRASSAAHRPRTRPGPRARRCIL